MWWFFSSLWCRPIATLMQLTTAPARSPALSWSKFLSEIWEIICRAWKGEYRLVSKAFSGTIPRVWTVDSRYILSLIIPRWIVKNNNNNLLVPFCCRVVPREWAGPETWSVSVLGLVWIFRSQTMKMEGTTRSLFHLKWLFWTMHFRWTLSNLSSNRPKSR